MWQFCLVGVFIYVFSGAGDYCLSTAAHRSGNRVRAIYFESLITKDISWYDEVDQLASLPSQMEVHLFLHGKVTQTSTLHAQTKCFRACYFVSCNYPLVCEGGCE